MPGSIAAFRKLLSEQDIDGAVITSPENVYYVSGYRGLERSFLAAVLIFADRDSTILVPKSSYGSIPSSHELKIGDRRLFGEYFMEGFQVESRYPDAISGVRGILSEMNLNNGTVGIEMNYISLETYTHLRKMLPRVELVDISPLLREMRTIKSETEIARIKKCIRVTERSLAHAYHNIREGVKELEIALLIRRFLVDHSADNLWIEMGVGARGAYTDIRPSNHSARLGELVFLDVGAWLDGYCSDLSRTAVVGEPSREQKSIYEALVKGQLAAISRIKPGISASEIHREGITTVRESGLPNFDRNHIGHGIGISPHEDPTISSTSNSILKPGMVLAVEMVYRLAKVGGFNVEDTVLVTPGGCEMLSSLGKSSIYACPFG